MFESIQSWGVTALMTSEIDADPVNHFSSVIEFQVDTVILLYNMRKGDIRDRSLEIFKMRGSKHTARILPINISDSGITVFPDGTVF